MKKTILNIVLIISSILFLSPVAYADTASSNDDVLIISDVWARKSMSPNNNSVVYMNVKNTTPSQIKIIGATAVSIANNVELHQSFNDENNISRMVAIDNIVVPGHSEIQLKPGGMHIMLLDLKQSLSAGDKFEITLNMEDKNPITVEFEVR